MKVKPQLVEQSISLLIFSFNLLQLLVYLIDLRGEFLRFFSGVQKGTGQIFLVVLQFFDSLLSLPLLFNRFFYLFLKDIYLSRRFIPLDNGVFQTRFQNLLDLGT